MSFENKRQLNRLAWIYGNKSCNFPRWKIFNRLKNKQICIKRNKGFEPETWGDMLRWSGGKSRWDQHSLQGRNQCQDYGGTCTRKFINIYRFVSKNTKKPARSYGLVVLCTPFESQIRYPISPLFYFAPTEKLFWIRPWFAMEFGHIKNYLL